MGNPGSTEDWYAILGVDPHADPDALRRAWRRAALRWHPDRAGPAATATFQRISAAWAVLSDPAARRSYDLRRGTPAPASAPPRRRAPATSLRRLCGPLNALLACGIARWVEPGLLELLLEPDEAASGGMVTIPMNVPVRCGSCGGAGCASCGGTGATTDLFAAWLAVPPDVADGTVLHPSAKLPGMLTPVAFRIRTR